MDVQHAREAPTEHPQWEFEDEDEEDNSKADESDDQASVQSGKPEVSVGDERGNELLEASVSIRLIIFMFSSIRLKLLSYP